MNFIFTCLRNIILLQHNIVKGGRGIKERTVNLTFLFKKLVKSYSPHSFWPGLSETYALFKKLIYSIKSALNRSVNVI